VRGRGPAFRYLAIHEAGHAVAAIRLRLSLRYTMLLARRQGEGSTVCALRKNGSPSRSEREAVLAYAGYEAETRNFGRDDLAARLRADSDFNNALELARSVVTEDETTAWTNARRDEARELVAAEWSAIEATVDALLERRRLSGAEVRALMTP